MPEIAPALERLRPAGNAPVVVLQVYGVLPPEAANVALYALLTVPVASEEVETDGGCAAAVTAMLSAFVAVMLFASFTCTVKEAVPAAVGVPEMAPALESVNPAGNAPVVILHA